MAAAEAIVRAHPQAPIVTEHLFHAGMYSRTIHLLPETLLLGAEMSLATVLIVSGCGKFICEDSKITVEEYAVIPGSKGRQSIFMAFGHVHMTMIFPTQAQTVEEAEREFTADHEKLMSRHSVGDIVTVTGE